MCVAVPLGGGIHVDDGHATTDRRGGSEGGATGMGPRLRTGRVKSGYIVEKPWGCLHGENRNTEKVSSVLYLKIYGIASSKDKKSGS